MATILITGASGMIGSALCKALAQTEHKVVALSRKHTPIALNNVSTFHWNIEKKHIEKEAFKDVDCIIHLAGTDIGAKRWTKTRQNSILASRVSSTKLLLHYVKTLNIPLKQFISTSASGYYGAVNSSHIFDEHTPKGNDFLSDVCFAWEAAAEELSTLNVNVCTLRLGVVLSNIGGALPKMLKPIQWGLGAPLGNGRQYMPWIHIEDVVNMYIFAVEQNLQGAYNAVASEQWRNKKFMRNLAKIAHRPFFMPGIPTKLLQIILGAKSSVITKGSRVSNAKIKAAGYKFKFNEPLSALHNLLD